MKHLKVAIIGCGSMGSAIAEGIVRERILKPEAVFLYDKSRKKAGKLAKKTKCVHKELSRAVCDADILIIAVKPQDFKDLFDNIARDARGKTVVSVMAGVKISTITAKAGKEIPVARVMPNIAAFVGESTSAISFNGRVTLKKEVKRIFGAIGEVLEIKEAFMNKITALSGSGPAYFFYLAKAMIEAGKEMGMDEKKVKELVVQTLYGSAMLLKKGKASPDELIKKVASKGGTTEAALSVLNNKNFGSIIKTAIKKAEKRAKELSGRG